MSCQNYKPEEDVLDEDDTAPVIQRVTFEVQIVDGTPTTATITAPNGVHAVRTARHATTEGLLAALVHFCTRAHVSGKEL